MKAEHVDEAACGARGGPDDFFRAGVERVRLAAWLASGPGLPTEPDDRSARKKCIERVLRDAELVDMGQLPEISMWIAGAVGSGVLGNAAYDALKKGIRYFQQRKGGSETETLLKRVHEELRASTPASMDEARARLLKLFADAGFEADDDVLPKP